MLPKRVLAVIGLVGSLFVVLAVTTASSAPRLHPSPRANAYPAGCSGNGTAVSGASLTYDGVAHTTFTTIGQPGVMVCRDADRTSGYGVYLYLYDGSFAEDLGLTYGAKQYTVSFTKQSGDTPYIVDGIGSIGSFTTVGDVVTLVVTPVAASVVNNSDRPAGCESGPSNSSGAFRPECAGTNASATETAVRVSVRFGSNWSNLPGMTVSASADLYQVSLSGPCPTTASSSGDYSGGYGGNDGGSSIPTRQTRQAASTGLVVQLLGPHFKADGTTLNQGSLTAVIPSAAAEACFGVMPAELESLVSLTRTEGTTTEAGSESAATGGLQYSINAGPTGLVITVPIVTFSAPIYTVKFARSSALMAASGAAMKGVKWTGTKGAITAAFSKGTTVKSYAIGAKKGNKGAATIGACAIKGRKVTCTIKKLAKGSWTATITSKLKAGGAGPKVIKAVLVK